MVVHLTKKAMQTYLYCVAFASTMDSFGMTAATECYSTQCPSDSLMKSDKNCFCVKLFVIYMTPTYT